MAYCSQFLYRIWYCHTESSREVEGDHTSYRYRVDTVSMAYCIKIDIVSISRLAGQFILRLVEVARLCPVTSILYMMLLYIGRCAALPTVFTYSSDVYCNV